VCSDPGPPTHKHSKYQRAIKTSNSLAAPTPLAGDGHRLPTPSGTSPPFETTKTHNILSKTHKIHNILQKPTKPTFFQKPTEPTFFQKPTKPAFYQKPTKPTFFQKTHNSQRASLVGTNPKKEQYYA
jgi:hypothetical protein